MASRKRARAKDIPSSSNPPPPDSSAYYLEDGSDFSDWMD